MKKLIISFVVAVFALGVPLPEAEARRLGGGGSFGMQRQATPPSQPRQPAATQQSAPRQPAAGTQAGGRSWMGPIAGIAAGLGLAALFSHLGLGEGFASFFLLALLAFGALMLYRRFARRALAGASSNAMQYAGVGSSAYGASNPDIRPETVSGTATHTASMNALAEGFDAAAFVRQAKVQFIRLQAAHDEGNLDDIRAFTTPEVFAEIRLQLAERTESEPRTDVVDLDAEVVEVAEESGRYIVSVRFHGLLREDPASAPTSFDEIWHLTKPTTGNEGWVIAGIQQVN